MDSPIGQHGDRGAQAILPDLMELVEDLPPLISTEVFANFMKPIYAKKTLSNMRWTGNYPKSFRIGRKVATTRQAVKDWLQSVMRPFDPDSCE
jgi:hypothetical protein